MSSDTSVLPRRRAAKRPECRRRSGIDAGQVAGALVAVVLIGVAGLFAYRKHQDDVEAARKKAARLQEVEKSFSAIEAMANSASPDPDAMLGAIERIEPSARGTRWYDAIVRYERTAGELKKARSAQPARTDASVAVRNGREAGPDAGGLRAEPSVKTEVQAEGECLSAPLTPGPDHVDLADAAQWDVRGGATLVRKGDGLLVSLPSGGDRRAPLRVAAGADWGDFILRMRVRLNGGAISFVGREAGGTRPIGFTFAVDWKDGFEKGVPYDITIEVRDGRLQVGGEGVRPQSLPLPSTVAARGRVGFDLRPGTEVLFESITLDRR